VRRLLPWLFLATLACEGSLRVDPGGEPSPHPDAGARPAPPDVAPIDAGAPPGVAPIDAGDPTGGPPPLRLDAGVPSDAGATETLTPAERDLLDAINDERASQGLSAVAIDPRLLCAARRHALDVGSSGACGHVGSDGTWPWDRAAACGFPQDTWTVNEIAAGPGFRDGADAVSGWRASSGHYAALTHPRARTVGVGVYETCFIALFDCCVAGSE